MRNSAIAIFAYKRPDHLSNLFQSLLKNDGIENLDIFVFIDGPKSQAELKLVEEVKSVALSFAVQINLQINSSLINLGLANSIKTNVSHLFKQYDSLIVLEDDLIVSKYFLSFVLEGLEVFENNPKISSISGYSYPIGNVSDNGYLLPGADCWGWATWKDRWEQVNWDPKSLNKQLRTSGRINSLNLDGAYDYYGMLVDSRLRLIDSWAIYWHASMFLSGKFTYYPSKTMVLNLGMDKSGTHFNSKSTGFGELGILSDGPIEIQDCGLQDLSASLSILYKNYSDSEVSIFLYRLYREMRRFRCRVSQLLTFRNQSSL
jgi:hypothetical protein